MTFYRQEAATISKWLSDQGEFQVIRLSNNRGSNYQITWQSKLTEGRIINLYFGPSLSMANSHWDQIANGEHPEVIAAIEKEERRRQATIIEERREAAKHLGHIPMFGRFG